jgi:hypothetical protein
MTTRAFAPPGGLAFVVPAVLLFLWWAATHNHPNGLIPPPDLIVRELADLVGLLGNNDEFSGSLWENLLTSASRVFGGFLLSAALGISLGMLIGRLAVVQRLLDSTLQMLRPIPVTAWQPLFLNGGDQNLIASRKPRVSVVYSHSAVMPEKHSAPTAPSHAFFHGLGHMQRMADKRSKGDTSGYRNKPSSCRGTFGNSLWRDGKRTFSSEPTGSEMRGRPAGQGRPQAAAQRLP